MEADANGSVFSTIMNRIRSRREPAADTAATDIPTVASPVVPEGSRMPSTTRQAAQALGTPSMAESAVPTAGAAGATLGGSLATEDDVMRPARDAQQQWGGRGGYYYSYTPAKGNTPAKIQVHGGPRNNRAGVTITESSNPDAFRAIMSEYDDMSKQGNAQPYVSLQEYRDSNPRNGEDAAVRDAVTSLSSEGRPGAGFEDASAGSTPGADSTPLRGLTGPAGSTPGTGSTTPPRLTGPAGSTPGADATTQFRGLAEPAGSTLGADSTLLRGSAGPAGLTSGAGSTASMPTTMGPAFGVRGREALSTIQAYEQGSPNAQRMFDALSPEDKQSVVRYFDVAG